MKRLLPVLLILTLLLCSCGANNTDASNGAGSTTETTQAEETVQVDMKSDKSEVYVGELVESDGLVFCINSIVEGSGEGFFTPEEGNKFVNIDMTFYNQGNSSAAISTLSFSLVDDSGTSYESSWTAPTRGTLDGTVQPGRDLKGQVAFEIPQDAVATDLLFDYDLFGTTIVTFKLDADKAVEPVAYTNPVAFNGIFKLGEVVKADSLSYVINGSRNSNGSDYMSPDEGNVYYIVDLEIVNTSSESQSISALFSFDLQDEFGYTYDIEMFTEEVEDIDADLEPEGTIKGEIVFEVPESLTNFELLITPSLFSGEQYVVEMQ